MILCAMLHAALHFHRKMHSDWFNIIEIFKVDGSMEKKWDTVITADLKRLFVSGTYVSLVMKGLNTQV
jgi:hypothetical protein